ncbi:MAG: AI-2E family transporter, partial [Sedimenticolaceae bacterium]|nr:AI-2E family transporter [Sedimenticolaceae bacterium]
MENNTASENTLTKKEITHVVIQLALIAFLLFMAYKIASPFLGLILWGLVLAVSLYPLQRKLVNKIGGREGKSATIIVLTGILLLGVPAVMMGVSAFEYVEKGRTALETGTIAVKPPPEAVSGIPMIGEKLDKAWTHLSTDLPGWIEAHKSMVRDVFKKALDAFKGIAGGLLMFSVALVIAGIMMAYAQSGSNSMRNIYCKFTGETERGEKLFKLSVATIRSVAVGVVGVAFIQAVLLGAGFVLADIPAAGLLAIVVLIIGILQLPALVITLPVIGYLWWAGDSTLSNVIFTIYLLIAGMADGFLKPMLLGRGVEAPMPVILIGALGGMVSFGLIGLFLGAVLLALGYVI